MGSAEQVPRPVRIKALSNIRIVEFFCIGLLMGETDHWATISCRNLSEARVFRGSDTRASSQEVYVRMRSHFLVVASPYTSTFCGHFSLSHLYKLEGGWGDWS